MGPCVAPFRSVGLVSVCFEGVSSATPFCNGAESGVAPAFLAGGGFTSLFVSGAKAKAGPSPVKGGVFVFVLPFFPALASFLFSMVGALGHCGNGEC